MRSLCTLIIVSLGALLALDGCKSSDPTESVIYLVRHAEKADDGTDDPPLTREGQQRAEKLSRLLKDEDIDYIFSSDYKRTKQTALPIAGALNKEIMSYDPGDFGILLNFINSHKGANFLVVGHSNSTPALANALLKKDVFDNFDESDYGNLIRLNLTGKEVRSTMDRF